MSLTNAPDPEIRAAVVRQDLANVLHPIVQHKLLETKQMVVTSAHGSTIYDADGTAYLDAMAGLWCVNIGYGRGELADVAADQMQQLAYFPHTQMNVPAAALAESALAGPCPGALPRRATPRPARPSLDTARSSVLWRRSARRSADP